MSRHRVGRLKLSVRAAKPDAKLAGTAAAFTRAILERCGDKLESRAPGRRFFVRRLPLRWTVEVGRLGDTAEIERLASELADDLAAVAVEPELEPTDADVVTFANEEHFLAAHWHACAQKREAWYFAALGPLEAELAIMAAPERAAILPRVLARLWRHDGLPGAIAGAPDSMLPVLERAAREVEREPEGVATTRVEEVLLALAHAARAVLSLPQLAIAVEVGARAGGASDVPALVAHVMSDVASPTAMDRSSESLSAEAPTVVGARHTALGGLFFLLNPLLELKAGELLYAACLPEGALLRHALACLLADVTPSDPALELCTGVGAEAELPQIAASQHAEVATALLIELVAALARRGLAQLPAIALHLCGSERLLVAHAVESPFAIFAWPASTPRDAATGLGEFLDRWPRSAPRPVGAPALCELDRSGRVRPSRGPAGELALPPAPDGPTAALLCQLVGASADLFVARAGAPTSLAGFVPMHLSAEADVIDDGDDRVVTLAAESIRFAQRRAGLDRDPGWVPWLSRHVRFRFLHPEDELP
jgi:hypothetical protein